MGLTHIDKKGRAKMVDITDKEVTPRMAMAYGQIRTKPEVIRLIRAKRLAKGNVFAVAQIAGIQAAKQTANLIPFCHPLTITNVAIDIRILNKDRIAVESKVSCVGKTGPDMEALTSVAASCLAIYDMCKAVDRAMRIERIYLLKKTGGKSGTYVRKEK